MKIFIIYKEKPNSWYISHLQNLFAKYNVDLKLTNKVEKADFFINNTRDYKIADLAKEKDIICFNNSLTCEIANNKWKTFLMCEKLKIPCMKTEKFNKQTDFPYVVKSIDGHGGNEVYLVENKNDFKDFNGYIKQNLAEPGIDVRVYVIGKEIICAIKRTSTKDFRSNYSLGGNVELFSPTKEQKEIVYKVQNYLQSDYIGVDFIFYKEKWVLNEIEDPVGSRALYNLGIDISEIFVNYLIKKFNGE